MSSSKTVKLGKKNASNSGSADDVAPAARAGASGADSDDGRVSAKRTAAAEEAAGDGSADEPIIKRSKGKAPAKAAKAPNAEASTSSGKGISHNMEKLPKTSRDTKWSELAPLLTLMQLYKNSREAYAGIYVPGGKNGDKPIGFAGLSVWVSNSAAAAAPGIHWPALLTGGYPMIGADDEIVDRVVEGASELTPMVPEKMLEKLKTRWVPKDPTKFKANNGWLTPTGFGLAFRLLGRTYVTFVASMGTSKPAQLCYTHIVDAAKIREMDVRSTTGCNDLDMLEAFLMFDAALIGAHLGIYVDEDNNVTIPSVGMGTTKISYTIVNDAGEEQQIFFSSYTADMAPRVKKITFTMVLTDGYKGEMKHIFKVADENEKPANGRARHIFRHIAISAKNSWTNIRELISAVDESGAPIIDWQGLRQNLQNAIDSGEAGADKKQLCLAMVGRMTLGFNYLSYQQTPKASKGQDVSMKFLPMSIYIESDPDGKPLFRGAIYAPTPVTSDGSIDPDRQLADAASASCDDKTRAALASAFADDD